jgi:hypothetical protein
METPGGSRHQRLRFPSNSPLAPRGASSRDNGGGFAHRAGSRDNG